jgi:two-component system, cell cycle response regulator DivK
MSIQSLSEQLASLTHHARLLVERTGDYTDLVEQQAASAERDLRRVETAASHATTADVDEARSLLSGHVRQTAAGAAIARRLCVSAHAQHAAACRLLADLDERSADGRRPNAVLVVDDYGEVRELVASVLRDAGFVVRTAANGLEGLIAAYEMRPGIIVMDVAMPVLDGIEATRLIKAADATRDARVIAYTGNSSLESAVVKGLFAAVLQKPATPDDVVAAVQHVASL